MKVLTRISLLTATVSLMISLSLTGTAAATTYYVAANGNDSNSGTSKTAPWLHAPGMPNCKNGCGSANPKSGDSIIFRGGDTWHFGDSSQNPYVGSGGWTLNWSGSSSSPIYVGVDQTWFTGGSWTRPVITGDNAPNGFVSSCAHDNSSLSNYVKVDDGTTYVTIDNFEFTGSCWSTGNGPQGIYLASTSVKHITIQNNYFHGWSTVDSSLDGIYAVMGSGAENADYNVFADNVVDGSDSAWAAAGSSHCHYAGYSSTPCYSGGGVYQAMYDMHGNIFRHLSDAAVTANTVLYHDNLVTDLRVTYTANGQHTNCLNEDANVVGTDIYIYNNVINADNASECFFIAVPGGQTAYIFNNVMYDNDNYGMDVSSRECWSMNSTHNGSSTAYFVNNTFDYGNGQAGTSGTGACQVSGELADLSPYSTNWSGTMYFENNHFISYDVVNSKPTVANAVTYCAPGVSCTFTDLGGNVFQTESAANAQGYTAANYYAPPSGCSSGNCVTVNAAKNLASSCSTYSTDSSLCSGTSDGAAEEGGSGGEIANMPAIPLISRPTAWDSGAYQVSSSSAQPAPPTGMSAVVQ